MTDDKPINNTAEYHLRRPTREELGDIVDWYEEELGYGEENARTWAENYYFVVFEGYVPDCPGYAGDVIVGVHGQVNFVTVWIYDDGELTTAQVEGSSHSLDGVYDQGAWDRVQDHPPGESTVADLKQCYRSRLNDTEVRIYEGVEEDGGAYTVRPSDRYAVEVVDGSGLRNGEAYRQAFQAYWAASAAMLTVHRWEGGHLEGALEWLFAVPKRA